MADYSSAPVPPLRDADHLRGPAAAPLVIVYGDFCCPHCALAHARLRAAPLRCAYRHFALHSKQPRAVALARAAEAAALQGRFWELHDALLEDQGRQEDPHLWAHVGRLGLDLGRFEADRRSDAVARRVDADARDGLRAGVTTTPTLFIDGRAHPGAPDRALLERLTTTANG
jgi:protein-disulfide isomerase